MSRYDEEMNATPDIIKLAVFAVGGQGGGVLCNWIVNAAERNGYRAQATSIAGVAQRTGATSYYVEMVPDNGRLPVFALAPSAGDVDILVAAEMMESGRAMMRGLVTPDRTTMITSTHRMLAMSEKTLPGNGVTDSRPVIEQGRAQSQRYIAFDMEQIAVDTGSVISASLFGALAGSAALPFSRDSFEETIRATGRGVETSLKAFDVAFSAAREVQPELADTSEKVRIPQYAVRGPELEQRNWQQLMARCAGLPQVVQTMALAGCHNVADFQDVDYVTEYLERLESVVQKDVVHGGADRGYRLSVVAAKYIANAMVYDDVIRVADLKTRAVRFSRIRTDIGVSDDEVLYLTEYFHPGAQEICAMFPVRLGRWVESSPRLFRWLDRLVNRGRRIRTDNILGFMQLYMIAGLRRWRRRLLRHVVEQQHMQTWLESVLKAVSADYDLAVEMIRCRRLVKGYSDTHARTLSKFDRVMAAAIDLRDLADAADRVRRLCASAMQEEDDAGLEEALHAVKRVH